MTSIAGQLVTEAFEYDDGRPVTVYIPPDPPQGIVFAGDGQLAVLAMVTQAAVGPFVNVY